MFRFGLPSFKLLLAGIIAAGAFAYYKGEFPDMPARGAKTAQPAAVRTVRPPKPVSGGEIAGSPQRPAKPVSSPRPTKISAPRETTPAPRPAEKFAAPRPTLTGSVAKKPRPPEAVPVPPAR